MLFDPVTVRADKVAIVATGPSAYGVPYRSIGDDVYIIAVKAAVRSLPRADAWMTVDANLKVRRQQMMRLREGTKYYAAVPEDYGTSTAKLVWHRKPAECGIHWLRRISGGKEGVYGLATDKSNIHSGNSAYGALGLAFHMGARKIAIFGVDATREPYGLGGYGRPRGELDHLPELFASSLPQLSTAGIEVVLGSLHSRLRCFRRMNAADTIEWINQ